MHFSGLGEFNNFETDHSDNVFILRPVFDHLNKKFRSVPMVERLNVDELYATKARHHLKI